MHLSTVGQLAHPVDDGRWRASRRRNRIVTNEHGLPGREQSETMEGYDCMRVGWREVDTLGNRSDLCKGICRSATMK